MSSFAVKVVKIDNITPHPNADRLECAQVKGWNVVVQKGTFQPGEKVIYAPIDSMIPWHISEYLEITLYLSSGRVRTAKLRGIYSQGLIMPLNLLGNGNASPLGEDVSVRLGISKYEEEIPENMKGITAPTDGRFVRYTSLENIKNYPGILRDGEEVVITEKIYGVNFRAAKFAGDNEVLCVGSHSHHLIDNGGNLYWEAFKSFGIKDKLNPGQILFGEIFGTKVSNLQYGQDGVEVRFFDLIEDGEYVSFDRFQEFCREHGLQSVPILYRGPWSIDKMSLVDGKSTMAEHIREGVVIKPTVERWDAAAGRVIFKAISERFLMKNYGDLH